MRPLVGFFRLPYSERSFVLRCWRLLLRAELSVRLQPLDRLLTAIDERVACRGLRDGAPQDALRLFAAAARHVRPPPACLAVALAGYEVLRERGWRMALVIGGCRTLDGFKAHAWLEHNGIVVIGALASPYQPIWQWPAGAVESSLPAEDCG